MAWCIGNNEFTLGCCKIPVCNVYCYALFTFVSKTICEKCEIYPVMALFTTRVLYGLELILENRFGII